jgi:hypothetical protein
MDTTKLKHLRKQIQGALDDIADVEKLKLRLGNISYSDVGFTARITAEELDSDGGSKKDQKEWDDAVRYGFVKSEWMNKIVMDFNRKRYTVVGYNFKKRKYPVIIESLENGKRYIISVERLKREYLGEK